jgi:hypothetical protein
MRQTGLFSWRHVMATSTRKRTVRSAAAKGSSPSAPRKKAKRSWAEKLADDKDLPKIGEIDGKLSRRWGEGTFVVPAPRAGERN